MRLIKNNESLYLKNKITNILMYGGKKTKGEKIIFKSFKSLQKSLGSKTTTVLRTAIVNSASAFKINEQATKKGKRKATKVVPSFIIDDSLRITNILKLIKRISAKNKSSSPFHQSFLTELLAITDSKSRVIEQKIEIQKKILMNRRYLTKFRW